MQGLAKVQAVRFIFIISMAGSFLTAADDENDNVKGVCFKIHAADEFLNVCHSRAVEYELRHDEFQGKFQVLISLQLVR